MRCVKIHFTVRAWRLQTESIILFELKHQFLFVCFFVCFFNTSTIHHSVCCINFVHSEYENSVENTSACLLRQFCAFWIRAQREEYFSVSVASILCIRLLNVYWTYDQADPQETRLDCFPSPGKPVNWSNSDPEINAVALPLLKWHSLSNAPWVEKRVT